MFPSDFWNSLLLYGLQTHGSSNMDCSTSLSLYSGSCRVSWCSGPRACSWGFLINLCSWMIFCHCCHVQVLGIQMADVFRYLVREAHAGASKVSHLHPVLCCCLGKVGKCLLYPNQVVSYVSALAQCLLWICEFGLVILFNGPGSPSRIFFPASSTPKIFNLLSHFRDESVRDSNKLGLCSRLYRLIWKVGTLV